jgi:catechol-2,3-dioxygenase
MLSVAKLDHVAIAVKDIEISTQWYKQTLGLQVLPNPGWGPQPIFLLAENKSGIALFESEAGNPLPKGSRLPHIAFDVTYSIFEAFQARFNDLSIDWNFQDHIISHSIYFRDPDDYLLEITTYDL